MNANQRIFLSGMLAGIGLTLFVFGAATLANAKERTTCVAMTGVCVTEEILSADPHVINVPPPRSEAAQAEETARDAKWTAYCQPRLEWGRNWVKHYVYAHEGCAMGRDSD